MKKLIENVPVEIAIARKNGRKPFLPIHPKSYRKKWQYDDEAYNFIYDFLAAFTEHNFPGDLQRSLNISRKIVATQYMPEELYNILLESANDVACRRYKTEKLQEYFLEKANEWRNMQLTENLYKKSPEDEISI